MAVTLQKIAEAAGVSRGTVDRALNNRGRIKPEVAKRIREIADEMGYQPNRAGSALARSKNPIKIGVITQLYKTSFMKQVNQGIQAAAGELEELGVQLIVKDIMSVNEQEQLAAIEDLLNHEIKGLAIMPAECDAIRNKINQLVEEKNLPVVTFNSDIVGTKRMCFVGLDNLKSGQLAAGLMGMIIGGKGKVLVITGYFTSAAHNMRVEGFTKEIKTSFPEIQVVGIQNCFDEETEVERIILDTLKMMPDLTGIFVACGGQSGICKALNQVENKKNLHVIAYDLTSNNKRALLEGNMDMLIDQGGFFQGYRAPMILADYLTKGKKPESEMLYTDIIIKTKYNI